MLKINYLEKTFDNIIEGRNREVYLMRVSNKSISSVAYQFNAKHVSTISLGDIQKILDDPNVALVSIEESPA